MAAQETKGTKKYQNHAELASASGQKDPACPTDRREINSRRFGGFTLIELLVVIAIIGMLASIVLVALNTARAKARNARRKADAHQFITALELYYNKNNIYPNGGAVGNKDKETDIQNLTSFLSPDFVSALPNDPSYTTGGENYQYVWNNNGSNYGILIPFSNDGGTDCQIDTGGADNSKWFKSKGSPAPICSF